MQAPTQTFSAGCRTTLCRADVVRAKNDTAIIGGVGCTCTSAQQFGKVL